MRNPMFRPQNEMRPQIEWKVFSLSLFGLSEPPSDAMWFDSIQVFDSTEMAHISLPYRTIHSTTTKHTNE